MPPSRLKPLYLGKTLADLKPQYEVNFKGKKLKLLCATAEKLFLKANTEMEQGDEELSYIDFMKFLSVVYWIQSSGEFKKDPNYFNAMLGGPQKLSKALLNAEKLSDSLEKRYKLMAEVDASNLEQEKKEAEEAKQKVLKATEDKHPQSIPENVADVSSTSLSSRRLFQLVNEKKMKILIIDSRPAASYADSHMTFDNCINIPNEVVQAGMSAAALEKLLPMESKELFGQRRLVDLIVLLDWTSTEKSLTPGSILYTIKTILLKWDPRIIYTTQPLILEGGYEDWLMTYPMCTTNPKAQAPSVDNDLDDLLDNIEYPSWNESPAEKPPYDRAPLMPARVPTAEPISQSADGLPISHLKETPKPSSRSENYVKPGVDRGSKAAAVQTYEERSRAINQLLKARETVADSSLEIEKDRLSAEKEWEVLRLQKEKEAEEGMKQQLQEREEVLLRNISKLEDSQRNQEAENQSLRLQLDEYKKRDAEESVKVADKHRKDREVEIKERIDKKEEEIKIIAKEREEIAKERMRQVEEDRRKRKFEADRKERLRLEQLEQSKLEKDTGTYTTQLKAEGSSSSIMKRSHSSPNIAQMMDDIKLEEKHKAPQFDRTIKPLQKPLPYELNAARQRNFNGVLGRVGRGLTGLKNLGNTCYMNSIVQCISNTLPIVTYFCEGKYREDVNHANKTHGEVVEEVAAVIRALWNGQYKFISCGDLKNIVGLHKEEFRGNQQQDSHEFLFFLINWLHDDLNKKGSRKIIKDTRENIPEADKQWSEFKQTNESLILTLLYGQQKSTVRCLTCYKESSTYEPFNHLSLPLPNTSTRCSLNDCLQLYLSGDRISGWNCPSCKAARDATKKFDICKLPPVLVIHLKRFYHDGWSRKKQTFVDFPLQELDMRDWTLFPNQRYRTYDLYGVSNHYGTMEGGHYTSYCKNNTYGNWYKFDDHEVNEISPSNVKTAAAYILFYSSNKL